MRSRIRLLTLGAAVFFPLVAGQKAASAGAVVLDTTGFWRMHHTLKPPMIQQGGVPKPMDCRWVKGTRLLRTFLWVSRETPPPAKDWAQTDFDDRYWLRGPARIACLTPFLARLCMRGSFTVTNPASVKGLSLDISYRGGVIVHLNGKEVARRHLPWGVKGNAALAEGYTAEAFTPENGWSGKKPRHPRMETEEEVQLRARPAQIPVPSRLLRSGRNVLGVEIIRAPYHEVVEEQKGRRGSRYCPYYLVFNTCQIDRVQLRAASSAGLIPNAVRPQGFQVWNSNLLAADFDLDFGDPGPLHPISLVGARNGRFSGKVVVGSTRPIRGLRVTASDLRGPRRAIPASAVRIRYGIPWGREMGVNGQRSIYHGAFLGFSRYPRMPTLLGALAEKPLAEFPVRAVQPDRYDLKTPGQPEPVFGAVVPVWVTVRVPKDAAAGSFKGNLTIRAQGEKPVVVPVELKVVDWSLPDPQDYRTLLELIQSPDTLVLEYGVKPWSDRHFEKIASAMKLMHEAGVHVLYIPLIAQTNLGNAETMVRWISRGGKRYDYDFSVMDRYLDLAQKHMGRLKVVCFAVWDLYLGGGGGYKDTWSHNLKLVKERMKFASKGPMVTMLDRAARKTETGHLPPLEDPSSKVAWKALFAKIRARMRKRGLEKAMMIGFMADDWPSTEENAFYAEVTGGLPWVSHSHIPVTSGGSKIEGGVVVAVVAKRANLVLDRTGFRIGYHSAVFNDHYADNDPKYGSNLGWRRPDLGTYQPRYEGGQPASRWRHLMELNITGKQRGMSRGGADFWRLKDRRGRRANRVDYRYPHSAWRNLNIPWCVFAPGPEGPVSTYRFEALREGIQECQARILIEEALVDERLKRRLGAGLARRCEELLVERTYFALKAYTNHQLNVYGHVMGPGPICRQMGVAGHRWFVGSGWQERTEKLFALAGQVAERVGR